MKLDKTTNVTKVKITAMKNFPLIGGFYEVEYIKITPEHTIVKLKNLEPLYTRTALKEGNNVIIEYIYTIKLNGKIKAEMKFNPKCDIRAKYTDIVKATKNRALYLLTDKDRSGYIYTSRITLKGKVYIKIGYTSNYEQRMVGATKDCAKYRGTYEPVWYKHVDDAYIVEQFLLSQMAPYLQIDQMIMPGYTEMFTYNTESRARIKELWKVIHPIL